MRYNKYIVLLIVFFGMTSSYSAEKWNVTIADWKDLSPKGDKNVATMIKKSIVSQLEKEKAFNVIVSSNGQRNLAGFQDVLKEGREYKSDVMIYGNYYIEGQKILVETEVFDVLENHLKMRKYYTGEVTIDIFDTIDSMSSDMLVKIKEVLPEMTEESETKVKKIRETLYESGKVQIKRLFYTRIGYTYEFGGRNYKIENGGPSTNYNFPFALMNIGLSFRYWDIRIDFNISGMPGLPDYDFYAGRFATIQSKPMHFSLTGGYFLPWFDGKFALGAGIAVNNIILRTESSDYKNLGPGTVGLILSLIYQPFSNWELNLTVEPFMNFDSYSGSDQSTETFQYKFPSVGLGTIYFFGDFGVEARFRAASGVYKRDYGQGSGSNNNKYNESADVADYMVYLGVVYKVDFLNQ